MDGFLINLNRDLKALSGCNKKIVLVGTGDNSFYAEKLLGEIGIQIYAYIDNLEKVQGDFLRGKQVYSPYDLFKEEDVYFIIAVSNQHIMDIRLQFMVHGVVDYGIFYVTGFHDYSNEDVMLHNVLLDAVNEICFDGETVEIALPLDAWNGGNGVGISNTLLGSTRWSNWIYIWENEFLEENRNAKVLEVGPGYGLMTLVLLKIFPNIQVDWLLMGKKNNTLLDDISPYAHSLKKIKTKYNGRINEWYDYIEKKECNIDKKYNLIILTEVLEHFALNPINTLKKLCHSLESGGKLVISTPNWGPAYKYKNWSEMPVCGEVSDDRYLQLLKAGHTYQYSKQELVEIFEQVGLEIEQYKISDSNNHNFLLKKKAD